MKGNITFIETETGQIEVRVFKNFKPFYTKKVFNNVTDVFSDELITMLKGGKNE